MTNKQDSDYTYLLFSNNSDFSDNSKQIAKIRQCNFDLYDLYLKFKYSANSPINKMELGQKIFESIQNHWDFISNNFTEEEILKLNDLNILKTLGGKKNEETKTNRTKN